MLPQTSLTRAFDADGVVVTRRPPTRLVHVVDDVDPANERDAAIDAGELAMQAAQAMATQAEAGEFPPIDQRLHAAPQQFRLQRVGKGGGTEAIDQYAYRDAAGCRVLQCLDDRTAAGVILEDVGFELDFQRGAFDGGDQRGKELGAAVQQRQPVATDEFNPMLSAWFSAHAAGQECRQGRVVGDLRPRLPEMHFGALDGKPRT